MKRGEFIQSTLTGGVLLPAGSRSVTPQAKLADARIEVLLDEPIGRIAPEIYGHFAEHLGGVVYDGIWVGENSKVPNIGGIRKELVEAMKKIKACAAFDRNRRYFRRRRGHALYGGTDAGDHPERN